MMSDANEMETLGYAKMDDETEAAFRPHIEQMQKLLDEVFALGENKEDNQLGLSFMCALAGLAGAHVVAKGCDIEPTQPWPHMTNHIASMIHNATVLNVRTAVMKMDELIRQPQGSA